MKTPVYPEYIAVLVAARKIGRPVHWLSTRSEAFMTDTQARDAVTEAELALDDNGKFLALRMRHLCSQGAYIAPPAPTSTPSTWRAACPACTASR